MRSKLKASLFTLTLAVAVGGPILRPAWIMGRPVHREHLVTMTAPPAAPMSTTLAPVPPTTTSTTVAPTTTTTAMIPTPTTAWVPPPTTAWTPPPATLSPAVSDGSLPAFLVCVRQRESGGDYTAVNPASGTAGAFQFSPSTWDATAAQAGRGDLIGIYPANASPADQDAMAEALLAWQGTAPWAGGNYAC